MKSVLMMAIGVVLVFGSGVLFVLMNEVEEETFSEEYISAYLNRTRPKAAPILLIRIIGNSLPPRHSPKQNLQNLKFVLENEVHDPMVLHKKWLLNRLVDSNIQSQIEQLLIRFNASYHILPFFLQQYGDQHFNLFQKGQDMAHSPKFYQMDTFHQVLTTSAIYNAKSLYVMGINIVRNHAIHQGIQAGYRWILPWDQNCFITEKAWQVMKQQILANRNNLKYYTTKTHRLRASNDIVLNEDYQPDNFEEPMIIFRNDSKERFNENLRYGLLDKCELLGRLNVPGPWMKWLNKNTSHLPNLAPNVGWNARLLAGSDAKATAKVSRGISRAYGVFKLLNGLNEKYLTEYLGFKKNNVMLFSSTVLKNLRKGYQNKTVWSRFAYQFIDDNNKILKPLSQAKYSHSVSFSEIIDSIYNASLLGIAYYITNDTRYARKATSRINRLFINSNTKLHPLFEKTSMNKNDFVSIGRKISFGRFFPSFLDSLRLLTRNGILSPSAIEKINAWMEGYYENLEQLDKRIRLVSMKSPLYGLEYDIQFAGFAAYLDKKNDFLLKVDTARARLLNLFSPDGTINGDFVAKKGIPNRIRNYSRRLLEAWFAMIVLGKKAGINMWSVDFVSKNNLPITLIEKDEGILCRAMKKNIPCCNSLTDKFCVKTMTSELYSLFYSRLAKQLLENCPTTRVYHTCIQLADKSNSSIFNLELYRQNEIPLFHLIQNI